MPCQFIHGESGDSHNYLRYLGVTLMMQLTLIVSVYSCSANKFIIRHNNVFMSAKFKSSFSTMSNNLHGHETLVRNHATSPPQFTGYHYLTQSAQLNHKLYEKRSERFYQTCHCEYYQSKHSRHTFITILLGLKLILLSHYIIPSCR